MLSPMDLVALLFTTLYSFPRLDQVQWPGMERAKEVHPDNSEELGLGRKSLEEAFRKNSPTSSRQ